MTLAVLILYLVGNALNWKYSRKSSHILFNIIGLLSRRFVYPLYSLGKLSKLKSGEIWKPVQSGDDPPLAGLGLFEIGTFVKWVDPLPP